MILNISENVIDGSSTNTSEVNLCEFSNAIENDGPYFNEDDQEIEEEEPQIEERLQYQIDLDELLDIDDFWEDMDDVLLHSPAKPWELKKMSERTFYRQVIFD